MTLENPKHIENVQQYYEILRSRQMQIIGIIKDTSQMLANINAQQEFAEAEKQFLANNEKNVDQSIRLAFSMIYSLANILDEQMNALNIWERVLHEERKYQPSAEGDFSFQDYNKNSAN